MFECFCRIPVSGIFSGVNMRSTIWIGWPARTPYCRTTCAPCWSLGTHLGIRMVAWCPGSTALNSPRSLGSLALMGLGDKRWTHHIYLPLLSTISQETVASVLTWATYELAKNPRVARKVKEEVPSSPTVPMKNDMVVSQFRPLFYVEMLPYHRETENCWLLRLPAINCLHIP